MSNLDQINNGHNDIDRADHTITGAQSLLRTLLDCGVDVCFANPGTSEMHFVDALDSVDGMRCILGLFEGVVTGAADGYARMLDRPAATLLHLGPGLANGLSNLHNAGRAQSPIVNVIGDHATYHRSFDAPLTSDIEGAARPFSSWVRTSPNAESVATDTAVAVAAATSAPGRVASLILPANTAWSTVDSSTPTPRAHPNPPARPSDSVIESAAAILREGGSTALVLGGRATREAPLALAGKIAAATGADLLAQTHNPRISRGAGRVEVTRIPYPIAESVALLEKYDNLILVGAKAPIAFFAYPDRPSTLYPPSARIHELVRVDQDITYALDHLVDTLGAGSLGAAVADYGPPDMPSDGPLTGRTIGAVVSAMLPEEAIVVDESLTTGGSFFDDLRHSAPHDVLLSTGGSIGFAMPNAIGAAVACPDRKVIALESDGSGLYMPQALWTMARENLDITVLVFANNRYRILDNEMFNVGAHGAGPVASTLFDLTRPTIDWVSLAEGFGVAAVRTETVAELGDALRTAFAHSGPMVIQIPL
ncbi:acetolactate synthase large subunit [Gordonia jinhuaensis]|uniref:acetolactate synthase large subunit n=1 Tax=Gordonia jinhuaensis TaxID=1517702 RepID=UPI001E4E80CD|nr:acetolactate synthase large subunit [Gordonia jinhuaensis]